MLRATALPTLLLAVGGLLAAPPAHAAARSPELTLVADGFRTLSNAVLSPNDDDRIYLVEQHTGRIRLLEDGVTIERPVLDLGDRLIEDANFEEGLLGFALAKDDPHTAYVSYIGRSSELILSRFALGDDGRRADPASEEILLRVAREERMHHCGHIAFGPHDGLLYLCVGDTQENLGIDAVSQDLNRPQGKILRLDPAAPSVVATSGPGLIATAAAATAATTEPEIWLHGLRNPWRFGFDPEGTRIFIPDVGRNHWEELNVLPTAATGGNLGWPLAEGGECMIDCTLRDDLIWPAFEYTQTPERCTIIGGAVYRGERRPGWHDAFVFADLCSGEIWAWRDGVAGPEVREVLDSDLIPVAILADAAGELLLVDGPNGSLWQLDLPEPAEEGWRPARAVMAEAALDARRQGFSMTREMLVRGREDRKYMVESPRWRLTEPFVRIYDAFGRPFD